MNNLTEKKCAPCEGGTLPLTEAEIVAYQKELTIPWEVVSGKKISRQFEFAGFTEAVVFVNEVARIAESDGHHPDIHIFYNKVTIDLWTHSIDGLSENDFILAAKIEKI
ncbi:MAG: 4a-hydroxytetrahydrobiopterin dehydratase [Candidatus Lloydbacteria bacterium CG22_combo_CG10-13_8_21_14_all_47_15]|uniref:4a-hydroxytetrahydrobiopterin dehydratase n=1 Tax=Candidatus Lloydbacteria bacterium CG22_combo_CG10-13_8_21_14_all_47_15 TaxID=1974635 RepID=A0A2H0CWQ1_9BACT|nr:MAG: 4a-hydroxytetrahydrobiopterin dehydratase [Candidatus Lloydbacteria bacterium CG22_combo_CG10-13_8_21_14_all_47_15]